jgi:hypothetical protein
LITAADMAIPRGVPPAPAVPSSAAPLRERILLVILYITVLSSSVAFFEPSPHDALMGLLALACLIAGVRIDRKIVLLFLLLLVWNAGGLMSLLNVPTQDKAVQYAATSVYLAVAALVFACLFAENTMPRLMVMRAAYVFTAVIVSIAAVAGYFNVFPGAQALFAPTGRALGFFKDPNVFAPFLIWPALIVLQRMVARRFGLLDLGIVVILILALLLAFSRGAWFHFSVSCAVMLALTFLTAPTTKARMRIFTLAAIGTLFLAACIVIALSFDSVAEMFKERAQLIKSYDVGRGGRFQLQEIALSELLSFPNGMGPFEFYRVHGAQQHNVYLQAFMVYGWVGGVSYILLVLATFAVALRTVFVATPWQPYLIVTLATFFGEALEGFIIDTDHWRHFFLILGMLWGLAAATYRYQRQRQGWQPGNVFAHAGAG